MNDFLALKADNAEWLIVVPMPIFRELMKQ